MTRMPLRPVALFVHGSADLYGSDRVLLNVVQGMAEHPAFEPWVLLHEDGPLRLRLEQLGIQVYITDVCKVTRAMWGAMAPVQVSRLLRTAAASIDALVGGRTVAFVYSNTLAVLGGAFWARRRHVQHVWHVHEIVVRPWIAARLFPRVAYWLSDRLICNSRQTRNWLVAQVPQAAGISAVVFNGLAMPQLPTASQAGALRAAWGVGPQDVLLTVVGRLNRMKGQGLLIEALALLRRRGRAEHARVVIVGGVVQGQEAIQTSLNELVAAHGLQDSVLFLPFTDDVFPIWMASNIAVVPSLEPESFGLVAIEAMACGVPVVAAAHGGMLDIVEDERTGLLFAPRSAEALADALSRLIADPSLRSRLGAAGALRQAREFDLCTQVQMTRNLCEELVAT